MERQCIKCGATITHHHKYCEKHYPSKSATILNLSKRVKSMEEAIEFVLNPSVNPRRYITKKQLVGALRRKGIKVKY